MNQYRLTQPWEDEIWRARQVAPVKAEAVAEPMRQATHSELGLRVHLADAPHVGAASLG
jgi:hypothetical protein